MESKCNLINKETLGLKLGGLSGRTISRYVRLGKIPKPLKIGKRVFWKEEQIDRWIDAGCPDKGRADS